MKMYMAAVLSAALMMPNFTYTNHDTEVVVTAKARLSQEDISGLLAQAAELVEVGGVYFHHANPDLHYKVLHVALCKETLSPVVVYQALYGAQGVWVRNVQEWLGSVEVDGQMVARFQKVVEQPIVENAVTLEVVATPEAEQAAQ